MKLNELVQKLGSVVVSSNVEANNPEILGAAAIDKATPGMLSYAESPRFAAQIDLTQASALILPANEAMQAQANERGIPWIATSYPRLAFAQTISLFYQPFKPEPTIHPSAVIDPTAQIGKDVAIGAHVVIQANVKIGNEVCIHPNVVIYPNVTISDRTVLHANCTIHERAQIGADCIIHAGAVIGSEGFGFVPTKEGWYKMQQSGYTVLEDFVEVGCNSAVDRPAVGETRVGRNTKLDNMVQVGHGVQIGQGCAIAAQVGIAGGVQIGNRVTLAGQVGIGNEAKIGDGAIASAKAGVHSDVAAGQIVSGYPAVDHKIYLKSSAVYSRLWDMYQAIKQMKRSNQ